MQRGVVSTWHDDDGWGTLTSPATPGGCWVHFSRIHSPGYLRLAPGTEVWFEFEPAAQDGYAFRATALWPPGVEPSTPPPPPAAPNSAYRSTLRITFDPPT